MEKPEKVFEEGDILTYKKKKDCSNKRYHHGGDCQGDKCGDLVRYVEYNELFKCWIIRVRIPGKDDAYLMLEREFVEYDTTKQLDNYPIC